MSECEKQRATARTPTPIRIAAVASHPIQYQAPLFQRLSDRPGLELEVLYLSAGVAASFDEGFGQTIQWDVDLLQGYNSTFIGTGFPSIRRLRKWLRGHDIQVVLVHGHVPMGMLMASGAAVSLPIPYMLRGEAHAHGTAPGLRRYVRNFVARLSVKFAAVGLPIGHLNREFYERFGASRTVFSPYSVDNERFSEAAAGLRGDPETRAARALALGLPPDRPIAVFAGKLQPWKRPLDAIEAVRMLDGEVSLLVIGDGPLREQAESAARGLPVAFAGFVNQAQLPLHYGIAQALVLPSEREPWGLVVNEAMACGLVPIASSCVGCGRDLVDGVGSVFPCGDVGALARALHHHLVAEQPNAAAIRARIDRYSLEAAADGIEFAARLATQL